MQYWSLPIISACWIISVPDFVHVLYNGRIVKSGTKELALELEERGYDFIKMKVDRSCKITA